MPSAHDNLSAATDAAIAEYTTLVARGAQLEQKIASLEDDLVAERAHIKALADRIAELEATQPPPPPARRPMLIGAAVDPKSGQTKEQAIAGWPTAHGPLLVRRAFSGSGFAGAAVRQAAFAPDTGVRARVTTFKGAASEFTPAALDSIPNDGFVTYLGWQHEGERGDKGNAPAVIRAGHNQIIGVLDEWRRKTGRADVWYCPIYMGWFERDTDPTTNTPEWWPTVDLTNVVLGLDPYDPNGKKQLAELVTPTLDLWRARGGRRWLIAEVGTKRTGTDGAAWVRTGLAWAEVEGCEAVCWFHANVGKDAPWWLDDPQTAAAWKTAATATAARTTT